MVTTDMDQGQLNTIVRILDRGQFNNSYKFALLRSLAAFGRDSNSGNVVIKTEWLAGKFIEFFWPLTLRFNIRQATVPDKDPVVMRYIRKEGQKHDLSPETKLDDFRKRFPDRYEALVRKVAANAFGDVLKRFHTVLRQEVGPRIYEQIDGGIRLNEETRKFLESNHKVLDFLAIGSWIKFTERYTSAPRLYEKINGLEQKRSTLKPYRKFLFEDLRERDCFYCERSLDTKFEVDHVIPWSFVAEDKAWNLVLACSDCNGPKSSSIPPEVFIAHLNERNQIIMNNFDSNLPPKVMRDFAEWRHADLCQHIETLAARCIADGFGTWTGP